MNGPILIADDLVTERITLKARLAGSHHRVSQVNNRAELRAAIARTQPDAIVMDVDFDGRSGVEICRELKSDRSLRNTPVLLYGAGSDRDARIAAFKAGADECLTDLPGERLLLALLRNLMRKRATPDELARRCAVLDTGELAEAQIGFETRMEIAIVAPETTAALCRKRALEAVCPAAIRVFTGAHVLEACADPTYAPDAIMIAEDPAHPDASLRLISELRARHSTRGAVIMLHTAGLLGESADMALDLGTDAVAPAAADAHELALRLGTLVARKRETDRLRAQVEDQLDVALRDPLTGLYNRRYAESYLTRLIRDARDRSMPFSVMILDLDHFKTINDQHGHLTGDDVLRTIASRLTDNIRDIDLAARIGGEEFLVVLQDADRDRAELVAERLRGVIAREPVVVTGTATLVPVTTSIGVATSQAGNDQARDLMEAADQALYASKSAGRNTVSFAQARSAA